MIGSAVAMNETDLLYELIKFYEIHPPPKKKPALSANIWAN